MDSFLYMCNDYGDRMERVPFTIKPKPNNISRYEMGENDTLLPEMFTAPTRTEILRRINILNPPQIPPGIDSSAVVGAKGGTSSPRQLSPTIVTSESMELRHA